MKFITLLITPFVIIGVYWATKTIFPNKPVEYTIITTLFTALIWVGRNYFVAKAEQGSLKAQLKTMEQGLKSLEELKKENLELKTSVDERKRKEAILSNYEFDNRKGIHIHKTTRQIVCPRCLVNKGIESPLKAENIGWNCFACEKFFPNPDYVEPPRPPSYPYS